MVDFKPAHNPKEEVMESANPIPETAKSAFQSIPTDQIQPSRHQARKQFDEESIKALAESMRLEGLIQPITVRRTTGNVQATGDAGTSGDDQKSGTAVP